MHIKTIIAAILLLWATIAPAQSIAKLKTPLSEVPLIEMPRLDNETLRAEEMSQRAPGRAPRFAQRHPVSISPQTHGRWETTPSGIAVWRLRLRSAGALSLNLGFDQYVMPEGGHLFLFSPDQRNQLGPFTPSDNQAHAQLWTPVLNGDEMVIEVQVPVAKRNELQLHLESVNHDFLGFSQMLSGSCNLDVICGAADGWAIVDRYRDIIQSVGVYGLGGETFCTGFLINNARNDCAPLFMTANHCGVRDNNAATLVVYWNFQNSTCRQPNTPASGQPGNGQLNLFNTGSVLLARNTTSDFCLVELNNDVPAAADAFYAGWNISDQAPQDSVICIHHPSTDEKRISFEFNPTVIGGTNGAANPSGNFIVVPDWDTGTTEGGSSGSPLFNRRKQVVGQLQGGAAACGNDSYDAFGWIYRSWTGGGATTNSLRPWLDPDNTGITEMDGRSARSCSFSIEALAANVELCAPQTAQYQLTVSENFTGPVTLSLSGTPAGAAAAFSVNPVMPGAATMLTISNTGGVAPGSYAMSVSGTDGTNTDMAALNLLINVGAPVAPVLQAPANAAIGASIAPTFTWQAQQAGTQYEFQIASDAAFNNIIAQNTGISANSTGGIALQPNTTYYWRVRGNNLCGEGPWSAAYSLTTALTLCAAPLAGTGLPITISAQGTPTINSTVTVSAPGTVASVKINGLDIRHTWVGDVRATLISPAGTSVVLFDQIGFPASSFGCDGDNLLLSFNDMAANTAAQLEATCNATPPAASGTFQPVNPLATFAGEPASGVWTMRIQDAASSDGGSLQAWSIEICTALPHEVSLYSAQSQFTLCASDTARIEFIVGTAFTNPVNLTMTGLPAGTQYAFSPQPAAAGQTVTAIVWGFTSSGNITASLQAEAGAQTAAAPINFTVAPPPAAPALLAPTPGAVNVALNPTLTWGAVTGATSYRLWVATDTEFTNIVVNPTLSATSFNLNNLLNGTTYYWRVATQGACGWGQPGARQQFTTVPDLSMSASPMSVSICNTGQAVYTINLGPGFVPPLTFTFSSSGPSPVLPQLSFATNNGVHTASVTNEIQLLRGPYQLVITVADAMGNTNNTAALLIIETTPPFPTLSAPANNAVVMTPTPMMSWNTATGADEYRVEVARDETMMDIVATQVQTGTSWTPSQALVAGDYFWRVTAQNECGNATTAPFKFTVTPSAIHEVQGQRLMIDPNPTQGPVFVRLQHQASADWVASVYDLNGILVQKRVIARGETSAVLDLSAYPAGMYVLRLQSGEAVVTQQIVKQ
ncbi:MAG TPA: proprotein convertase P-domain-containing protein [Saprospiraceae bacterium]|nr:proprotein convertase P-domain-containing protein [Saprospiraceae bacterium]HRJ13666.1 proprotein convertase P-domain-containing protein [Saprospiraceae bacterium]HRK81563.1 proprotein convertase P-domain-containing protein [Saprospiraceae bacterium]